MDARDILYLTTDEGVVAMSKPIRMKNDQREVRVADDYVVVVDNKKNEILYHFEHNILFDYCMGEQFNKSIINKHVAKNVDPLVLSEINSYITLKDKIITLFYKYQKDLEKCLDKVYLMVDKGLVSLKKEDLLILTNVFGNIDPKKPITIGEYKRIFEKYIKAKEDKKLANLRAAGSIHIYYNPAYHREYISTLNILMDFVSFFVLNE